MVVFPHCKINLGLRIISKRPDGYHAIETCFYPVPLTDILEIIPSASFSFGQSGLAIPGSDNQNLCRKAYELLAVDFKLPPINMHLHKVIPMGAGLGGGSSDAAFTLRLINQIFELNISEEKLRHYAAQVGSDCSFFIQDKPMFGTGRGEILSECTVRLSGKYLVLVNPDVHVSTAEAYANVKPGGVEGNVVSVLKQPIHHWRSQLVNDFEASVFNRHPVLAQIKETLYSQGAVYASMSGSGATVYGIFEKPINLQDTFTGYTYWAGTLP